MNVLEHEPLIQISFHVPRTYAEGLDELVRRGLYPSRSEAIRDAIAQLLERVKAQFQLLPPQIQQQQTQQQQGSGGLIHYTARMLRVLKVTTGDGNEHGNAVIIKCAGCGYEMLVLADYRVAKLIKALRMYNARCPRCGSHELLIQYVRMMRRKQQQQQEITQ